MLFSAGKNFNNQLLFFVNENGFFCINTVWIHTI